MLDQRRAALDPVAAVVISGRINIADHGNVDVPANNPLDFRIICKTHDALLEFADVIDCAFDFPFRVSAERPVTEAKAATDEIDGRIQLQQKLIADIPDMGEPLRALDDGIEFMAVDDEQAATVGGGVNGAGLDGDVAEIVVIRGDELVVIPRDVNKTRAFAGDAEELLDDVVMRLRPVKTTAEAPDINEVADDVEGFKFPLSQEIEQRFSLRASCAEMNVRNPASAKMRLVHVR